MPAKKRVSRRSLKSDLARVDTHLIKAREYKELPELTRDTLARGSIRKGGRPVATNPRKLITIRLPADVIARWRATGRGWQTRMAQRLSDPGAGSKFSKFSSPTRSQLQLDEKKDA